MGLTEMSKVRDALAAVGAGGERDLLAVVRRYLPDAELRSADGECRIVVEGQWANCELRIGGWQIERGGGQIECVTRTSDPGLTACRRGRDGETLDAVLRDAEIDYRSRSRMAEFVGKPRNRRHLEELMEA